MPAHFAEIDAARVVLVRQFETDAASAWSAEQSHEASRLAAARAGVTDESEFLARRARVVLERAPELDSLARRLLRWVRGASLPARLLPLIAFLVGALGDSLASGGRINIIALPLLGILAWNCTVYLVLGYRWVRLRAVPPAATASRWKLDGLRRLGAMLNRRRAAQGRAPDWVATVAPRFLAEWNDVAGSLSGRRIAALFHVSAALLAAGALVALYWRGLGFEYRAGWESTFLDPSAVHRLVRMVFGLASQIANLPLPSIEQLARLRFPDSSGENAASWIHLHALTLGLLVILPRIGLAIVSMLSATRLARAIPLALDAPYYRSLLRDARGGAAEILLMPYGLRLDAQRREAIDALVRAAAGGNARVRFGRVTAMGEEDQAADALPEGGDEALVIAIFGAGATPEKEHHARFLEALREARPMAMAVSAIVDEAGFVERFGDQPARVESRRSAWQRLLRDAGLTPAVFLAKVDAASATAVEGDSAKRGSGQAGIDALAELIGAVKPVNRASSSPGPGGSPCDAVDHGASS
ncbi:MAG: DUF2868 domain-containing protein [Burkholderiaceae bacterium]|nr:DUF2868 domain-containing protein [Burkholderiaceae bacterium]